MQPSPPSRVIRATRRRRPRPHPGQRRSRPAPLPLDPRFRPAAFLAWQAGEDNAAGDLLRLDLRPLDGLLRLVLVIVLFAGLVLFLFGSERWHG